MWTISPTMINEARASVSVDDVYIARNPAVPVTTASTFGIDFHYILPGLKASEKKIPTASVPNFSSIAGGPYPSHSSGILWTYSDSVTKVWGNHSLKGGIYLTYSGENDNDQINVSTVPGGASNQNGTFIFTDSHSGGRHLRHRPCQSCSRPGGQLLGDRAQGLHHVARLDIEYFAQDNWQINSQTSL